MTIVYTISILLNSLILWKLLTLEIEDHQWWTIRSKYSEFHRYYERIPIWNSIQFTFAILASNFLLIVALPLAVYIPTILIIYFLLLLLRRKMKQSGSPSTKKMIGTLYDKKTYESDVVAYFYKFHAENRPAIRDYREPFQYDWILHGHLFASVETGKYDQY